MAARPARGAGEIYPPLRAHTVFVTSEHPRRHQVHTPDQPSCIWMMVDWPPHHVMSIRSQQKRGPPNRTRITRIQRVPVRRRIL